MKKIGLHLLFLSCALSVIAQNVFFKSPNESLEIQDKKITYSVTSYQYASPVSATPISSETKTIYNHHLMSATSLKQLKKIIRKANFYQLPSECGAPKNKRSYPESLEISWKGKSHKVTYRSNPEYPSPSGYDKLKSEIFNVIDQIPK